MKNGRWEKGDRRCLFHRSMPHIPLRYMWFFQQFTLLRSVSAYCGYHGWCSVGWLIWPIRGRIRACGATFYKTTRCVSSGTLTIFIDVSGLKPGVPHKSVLSGDGIQFPYPHPTQSALRPPFSACLLREMGVWKIFFAGVGSFANFAIWRGNIRDGVGLSLCP